MSNKFKSKTIIGGLLLCSLAIGAGAFADHDNMVHHSNQRVSLASKNNKDSKLSSNVKKAKDIMNQIKPVYDKVCTHGKHKGSKTWNNSSFVTQMQSKIKGVYNDGNDDLYDRGKFSPKYHHYNESYDAHLLAGLYDGISSYYNSHKKINDNINRDINKVPTVHQDVLGNLEPFPWKKMKENDLQMGPKTAAKTYFSQVKASAPNCNVMYNHIYSNKSNTDGNFHSGSPIHDNTGKYPSGRLDPYGWDYNEFPNTANGQYSAYIHRSYMYDWKSIDLYHTQLADEQLQERKKDGYGRKSIQVVMPKDHEPQSIKVAYPHSVKVITGDNSKPQYADVELEIHNIHYYGNNNQTKQNEWQDSYKTGMPEYQKGNPSNKSFVFSKNIGNGFRFNGVTSFDASYTVLDSKTGKHIKLSHAYIGVDHIDGEATYKYHPDGFSGRTAEQDFRNNEVFMHTGFHTTDPTGQFVDSKTPNMTPYSYDKKTNERKIAINPMIDPNKEAIGGLYGKSYSKLKGTNGSTSKELDHAVLFNLNNSNNFDINAGSSTGYGLLRPFTHIKPPKTKYICKKYTYKEPNGSTSNPSPSKLIKYINIVINRDGQNSKAIPLSDFVGKNAKQHVNQTMFKHTTVNGQTNGDGGNYKKATILVGPKKKQYREFKNNKQAVKWASNINCLVVKPPKPQPCKQGSKQCPTQKFQKTVMKKGPDGSIHVPDHEIEDYDNGDYYNGGILKHPNQKYDYKIHGQLPLLDKQAYYYKSSTDSKGHTTYSSIPTYYDDSRDNFVLNDTIPSEVKMLSVPQMKVNGQSISATSGMSHNMQFKFNESQLAGLQSGGTQPVYDVYIPVEAAPRSGSNKDFDSSQKGYGLPDVTGSNYKHWLSFLNKSNFSSDIHVGYKGSTNEPDSKKSNALVNIKEIKATIYNYNYNKNYYPNSEQPYGFNFNKSCNKTSTDPTSRYYKDYRYHSKRAKAHKIGDPLYYYGYVNSDFAVRSLKQDQGNHNGKNGREEWRYRLVYPSLPVKGYLPATNSSENNNSVWNINSKRYQAAKDSISDDWSKKDPNYWADNDNANNALPMVFNPDDLNGKCGNDAYTSSGFSQTNYIPYIVPHISFIPEIPNELKNLPKKARLTARLNRDGQLIVDTDSAKHGLPFRFNMRAQNVLYGYHFWNDFKDDNGNPDMVTMHVTAGKGKHAPELYKATRRLVGNKSNSLARFNGYKHQHYVTKDEWPQGNHNWTGYDEADAFKADNSSKYDLDTSKLHLSKGEKIPLHVHFTSTGLARISYRNLDSHAYNAAKPKVMRKTNKSFGYTHNVSDGSDSVKGNNNPNKSTYIEPERTVKYFGESPNDPDKQVRELKEELNVTQPHYAYGKTGYGMTANDLGISYAGHLEEPRYVHKGTNMTYAFPSPFQKKDTHIKYSKDNRHSGKLSATIYKNDNKSTKTAYKRLADVLLHVEPHSQSHQVTTSNGIDNGMPSNLDDPNGIKYYADADNYYGDFLNKEKLWSGKFATSYGFYPRQATHNVRTSSNGIDSNGGDITIAPHGPSGIESKRYDDKPVSDVKMLGDLPHTMNGFNGYGLNGVKTNNGMTHDFNTITKTQGVKDAQMSNEDIKADGQDERMFTPIFMNTGWYSTNFHRSYRQMNRKHRLGGNFFDIDENRPIKFYGHIYIAKNSKSKENDEFSLQPILSNTKNGLSQTPSSAPLFPTDWLSSADGSMAPNWYDAKIFAKKHKHHGHKRWSMNIGTHQKELEKKY